MRPFSLSSSGGREMLKKLESYTGVDDEGIVDGKLMIMKNLFIVLLHVERIRGIESRNQ